MLGAASKPSRYFHVIRAINIWLGLSIEQNELHATPEKPDDEKAEHGEPHVDAGRLDKRGDNMASLKDVAVDKLHTIEDHISTAIAGEKYTHFLRDEGEDESKRRGQNESSKQYGEQGGRVKRESDARAQHSSRCEVGALFARLDDDGEGGERGQENEQHDGYVLETSV